VTTYSCSSVVPWPPEVLWAWHERPGALHRLSPPWLRLRVLEEPASLRDGRAVFALPGGLRLVSEHSPAGYEPGARFADSAANAPFELIGWKHERSFSPAGEGSTLLEDHAWSRAGQTQLARAFAFAHRQISGDLSSHGGATRRLTVAVTGTSGLIGSELAAFLSSGGHKVLRLVRRPPASPDEREWDPAHPAPDLLAGADAVVHLAGAPIAGRFTEAHKELVWQSRVGPTQQLATAAAQAVAAGAGPKCFVCASAVGFYGYRRDDGVDEGAGPGEGFLARLVAAWEAASAPAAAAGIRVVNVRTGVVQSPRGGVLGLLYPLFLAGLGGPLGSGQQWLSWIGVDDLVDVYLRALLDAELSGPVNAVTPSPVTWSGYARTLGAVLGRPVLLRVPAWAAGVALGSEGATEFALASQRVVPGVLQKLGHRFRHPDLEGALRHVLGRVG
jgi:uncharacterized protein (TIGR01777 family)